MLLWPQPAWAAGPVDACYHAWLRYLLLSVWTSALSLLPFSRAVRVWFPYGQRTCWTFGVGLLIFYGARSFIWLDLYLNSVESGHRWEFPWAGGVACLWESAEHCSFAGLLEDSMHEDSEDSLSQSQSFPGTRGPADSHFQPTLWLSDPPAPRKQVLEWTTNPPTHSPYKLSPLLSVVVTHFLVTWELPYCISSSVLRPAP